MIGAIDDLVARDRLLEEAGYRYSLRNDIYVNRAERKVFSVEFVEEHTDEQIRARMMERPPAKGWQFYFNDPPSAGVRRELTRLLDNGTKDD